MDWVFSIFADAGVQEALLGLFGVLLTIIINRAAGAFQMATGIAVERDAREALHEAIKSGVEAALERGPETGVEQIKAHAIFHARESVPDAIRILVPGEGVLDRLAVRYYRESMERLDVKMRSAAAVMG
ncbi:hypothetical protein [Salipiger mucosus]|uniref:Uncharacterized protein n=1 Tax=Salipiger mucosus DSM 16094 TaxID=1123237 RepID=S9RK68_9RHOB|nr:hypothetical protein [Salipiger mucosus]EPX78510.1 hypothetical protein Salmuc_03621 [Salipiger mucosus DSM 16094]